MSYCFGLKIVFIFGYRKKTVESILNCQRSTLFLISFCIVDKMKLV